MYVGWVCALCGAVLWQAEVFLCGGRLAVGEGGSVGSCVGTRVVLPDSMCCISAYSVAPSVGTLVLCCWGFCMCLGICMVRAFGLQRRAFVWMMTMIPCYPRVFPVSPGCQCVLDWCGSVGVACMDAAGYVGGACEVIVLYA